MSDSDMASRPQVVLVADDDAAIRRLYSRVLARAGFRVVEAVDGEDALAQLAAIEVSLLLLDSSMPRLNGPEVIRRLRADAATASMPIILVTGSNAEADRIQGLRLGADDYLVKPVPIDELVARVRAHARA